MKALTDWLQQLQFDGVWQTAVLVCASLLCITLHETCHGLMAYALGDPTAKRMGRLTLNPLKHVDISGLLMMALFRFGWAKPVPVDMRRFKNPKRGMALTALAGPVCNLILTFMAAFFYLICAYFCYVNQSTLLEVLSLFFGYTELLSAGLTVFNLIPIPPLDGSKVLFSLLPSKAYAWLMRYEKYGAFVLMALLFLNVLDTPLMAMREVLLHAADSAALWAFSGLLRLFG